MNYIQYKRVIFLLILMWLQNNNINRVMNRLEDSRIRQRRTILEERRAEQEFMTLYNTYSESLELYYNVLDEIYNDFFWLKDYNHEINDYIVNNIDNFTENEFKERIITLNLNDFFIGGRPEESENDIQRRIIRLYDNFQRTRQLIGIISDAEINLNFTADLPNIPYNEVMLNNQEQIINNLNLIVDQKEDCLRFFLRDFNIKSRNFDKLSNDIQNMISESMLNTLNDRRISYYSSINEWNLEELNLDENTYDNFKRFIFLINKIQENPLIYFGILFSYIPNQRNLLNIEFLNIENLNNLGRTLDFFEELKIIINKYININYIYTNINFFSLRLIDDLCNQFEIFYETYTHNQINNDFIYIDDLRAIYNFYTTIDHKNKQQFYILGTQLINFYNIKINYLNIKNDEFNNIKNSFNQKENILQRIYNVFKEFSLLFRENHIDEDLNLENEEENLRELISEGLRDTLEDNQIMEGDVNHRQIIEIEPNYFINLKTFVKGEFIKLIPEEYRKMVGNIDQFFINHFVARGHNTNIIYFDFRNKFFHDNNLLDPHVESLYDLINQRKELFIRNILYNIDKILLLGGILEENLILKFIINVRDPNGIIVKKPRYYNYIHLLYGLNIEQLRRNEDGEWGETRDFSYDNVNYFPDLFDIDKIIFYNLADPINVQHLVEINPDMTNHDYTLFANPLLDLTKKREGMFFDKVIKDEYSFLEPLLEEFQIFTKENINNDMNCFINCLKQSNLVSEDILKEIQYKILDNNIPLVKIKNIAKDYNLNIKITCDKKVERFYYNQNEKDKIINIYLYRGKHFQHYMLNKKTNITSFFIKNIKDIMKLDKPLSYKIKIWTFRKDRNSYAVSNKKGLKIKHLIPLMIKENILTDISSKDIINKIDCLTKHFTIELPQNLITECKLIKKKEEKDKVSIKIEDEIIFFADTECFTQDESHKAYCICFTSLDNDEVKHFYGENCLYDFLEYISYLDNRVIIYFHNLSYDFRMFYDFRIIKTIEKNNKIYSAEILWINKYKKKKIIKFKDSLCMINTSISNFHSWFKLEGIYEKEIYPYNYYTKDTFITGIINNCWIKEKPLWNIDKINQFKENLKKLNLIYSDGIRFNSKNYCIYYCERDVLILKKGWTKFRQMFLETLDLDIHKSLTISSLAYKYIKINSLYDQNIYEYGLLLRDWIRQSVIGGRCMVRDNSKYYVQEEIYDYDACSLYPSAMKRLFLPTGLPEIIPNDFLNFSYLDLHTMKEDQINPTYEKFISCYIVEIEILEIEKERHFPLITTKDEKGSNLNVNKICKMFVSNITLEDLVKYQKIKFNIIKGIYWKGKKSTKLSNDIEYLYNYRLKLKEDKNPAQICIKELMNSSYGKTIQKPELTEIIYKHDKTQFLKYLLRNAHHIENTLEINSHCYKIIKKVDQDNFYVPCLIGSLILSMSKRIMNEVICLGEDLNCKIYYQDTDSIHINKNDLLLLEKEYEKIYNRKLRGTNMGQFHPDFEEMTPGKTPYAIKSIFISKKIYIDKLTDETGKIGYHFRMKGIPSICIKEKAKEFFGDLNGEELIKLYEQRYYGEKIKFSLSDFKPCFKMTKDFHVLNLDSFERII